MQKRLILLGILSTLILPAAAQTGTPAPSTEATVETVICVRHGERTRTELGQLTIRGLNRALALPKVLLSKYGKPQYIFAPDPSETIGKPPACYVRPLATIEPTAIYCDMPVNTLFGFTHVKELEDEIDKPLYANSLVFVAWEHGWLDRFVHQLVRDNGGDPKTVPGWNGSDFDSIFIVKITRQNGKASAVFTLDHENLNNLSDVYPGPAPTMPPTP